MRAARCTIDTSTVIALDALGLLPTLSFLFSRVLLPKAVRSELFRRRATKDRLRGLLRENAFLERCDDYDKGAVDTLLAGRSGKPKADRGEAEAVVQAAHAGAVTIVDDPWGRSLARSYDLEFHGTLWVLRRLWELQLREASPLREDVIKLRRRGTRFPETEVNDLLKEMGQAPLGDTD